MRQYEGYPLARVVAGIARIHRRYETRVSPRGKLDVKEDDIRFYLMSLGFRTIDDFIATLAARTGAGYARRVVAGHARSRWN
jgi:hypothetical protein